MSKIDKRFILLDPSHPDAITANDIYYDDMITVKDKINDITQDASKSKNVTPPIISGPTAIKYGKTITLTATGSLTAFADSGATIDNYFWTLPDDSTHEGDTVTYDIPNNSSLVGQTLKFKCYAKDTLNNESRTVIHTVEIIAGGAPDIDGIEWSESPPYYDNYSYTVTIHASDPDNDPLTYSVTCDDANVTIEQDTGDPSKFNIIYPDYTSDTTVTFTFTVSDGTYEVSEQQIIEVKDNIPPTIDQIVWDGNPPHYYGETHNVTVYATDPEGASLTYDLTCNDENVTIQQDGTNPNKFQVTYPNYTSDTTVTFTFHVSDGIAETTQNQNILVKANKPPVIESWSWSDNPPHVGAHSYDLTINASDPENDTLTYSVTCDDSNVTIQQDGTDPNKFHITYPDYSSNTNVTFTMSVSDGINDPTIQTTTVSVNANHAPVIDGWSWDDDPPHGDNNTYTLTISAHDSDGDPLDYSLTCSDSDVTIQQTSSNKFQITYPDYSSNTNVTFTIHVSDGIDTTSQSFSVLVENRLPTGDTGVFGGGDSDIDVDNYNIIDYITISTLGNAQDFGDLTATTGELAATSNGTNDRGVFGGGYSDYNSVNTIDYITISSPGNAQDFGDLTRSRRYLAATSNGTNDRGVFGGGTGTNTIDYITISSPGNAHDFGDLTVSRYRLAATSNGINNRGVFGGGGENDASQCNVVDYITISTPGNAQDFGDLTERRTSLGATSNGTNNRGVFGGGNNGSTLVDTIDYITISSLSNASYFGDLRVIRSELAATSNGTNDRGVFGGGHGMGDAKRVSTIDYITISTSGNAQDFGDLTRSRRYLAATSNA